MSKTPNPHPQSPSQSRAKSVAFAARESVLGHAGACGCAVCVVRRFAFVAGWRACKVAGRKGAKRGH